jgi:hypothetical protein
MSAVLAMEGHCAVVFGTPDRVEFHLANWARWMRTGQAVQGHASESCGLSSGGTSKGFDEMVESEDRRCAQIVDAVLDNLPPVQRIAIYIHKGVMGRVFEFKRMTFHQALTEGKAALGRELSRRGVW